MAVGTSHNHQPSVAVYISVGNIDAVFGKIQRAGGRMAMPMTELPGDMGSIAGPHDPCGQLDRAVDAGESRSGAQAQRVRQANWQREEEGRQREEDGGGPRRQIASQEG